MRRRLLWATLVIAFALTAFVGRWLVADHSTPRFIARAAPPRVDSSASVSYEFLSPRPFVGGMAWVTTTSGNSDYRCYLLDIDRRRIVGELRNASPVFMNDDGSTLLCVRRNRPEDSLRERLTQIIERSTRGKIRFAHAQDDQETFWLVGLSQRTAARVGEVTQFRGAGSSFVPSPTLRYGFNKPTGSLGKPEFFLCDLDEMTFDRIAVEGWPVGWWTDTAIALRGRGGRYLLYDVRSKEIDRLLAKAQIDDFLACHAIENPGSLPNLTCEWNGEAYAFYLTDTHRQWLAQESFLISVAQPDADLGLFSRSFKFEWSDQFQPSGRYYLYSGRQSGDRSSGVFLRDLEDDTVRTLVPPDGTNSCFSIPNFYGDTVIYIRSNALWQINLDGENAERLFPPS